MLSSVKKIWLLAFLGILFSPLGWSCFGDTATSADNFWIDMSTECMIDGTCTFSIYDATKIKKDRAPWEKTSVMNYLQDIILAATTFIWTVVTLALIVSGLMYIFSTVNSSMKAKAKSGIMYSLIGMVIVFLALIIIRLVQFLVK